jgi:hypothetical protein
MKHVLVFFAATLISFCGCNNKAAKNSVSYPAEEFYNDSLPDELQNIASIEFVSPDDFTDRIDLLLKEPKKINQGYPPLLQISDDESYWTFFTGNSPARWLENGEICLAAHFRDSIYNVDIAIEICEDTPKRLHLNKNGEDNSYYTVANYTTFEIYEGEDDEYFYSVLEELEQKSSRVDKIPPAISNLVPSNYELYFCAIGNLNRDKYDDAIIIVKGKHRECWILTGIPDNSFKINIIKKIDDIWGSGYFSDARSFEDPLFDIVIKNGYFSVEQYGGVSGNNKSINVTHFKYSKSDNNWLLFRNDYIPSIFVAGNCCYNYHLTTHYVEKILIENYGQNELN